MSYRIRELEWELRKVALCSASGENYIHEFWSARSLDLVYDILPKEKGEGFEVTSGMEELNPGGWHAEYPTYSTLSEAKEACQKDFEEKVNTILEDVLDEEFERWEY